MNMTKLLHDPLNIVICGIGGQGNILASELLGSVLVDKGYMVAIGETYGASQRGGSVMSHVRVSEEKEMGVLIPKGEAHIIVGFEPLETLRMLREYGNIRTQVIYDPRVAYPLGVMTGEQTYPDPEVLVAELKALSAVAYAIPAAELAGQAGNYKAANIALMGALTRLKDLPLTMEDYTRTLEQRFSGKALEVNYKAFKLGYDALEQLL